MWKTVALSCVVTCMLWAKAHAAAGLVILEDTPGCDYFVVQTTSGFALLEWYGGIVAIWPGDEVYGDFESYGFTNVHIKGRGEMRVWVEDYWANGTTARNYFQNECG